MAFLDRLLKNDQQQKGTQGQQGQQRQQGRSTSQGGGGGGTTGAVAPERRGLRGEDDEKGLAKRVAQAFDQEPTLVEIETVMIDQDGTVIILSGVVTEQTILDRMETIARGVEGTSRVDSSGVKVGNR